jgi:hypothetical protein
MVHGNRLTCTIKFQFWYRFLFKLQQIAVGALLSFDSFRCFLLLNFLFGHLRPRLFGLRPGTVALDMMRHFAGFR